MRLGAAHISICLQVQLLSSKQLQSDPEVAVELLSQMAGPEPRLHIHLDLDVLDPVEFPHVNVPTPGGLAATELQALLVGLGRRFRGRLCGLTVTELQPRGKLGPELLEALLGAEGLDLAEQVGRARLAKTPSESRCDAAASPSHAALAAGPTASLAGKAPGTARGTQERPWRDACAGWCRCGRRCGHRATAGSPSRAVDR